MDLRDVFAPNLRWLRHAKGLAQDDLAYEAEVSRSYLSQLEKAARSYAARLRLRARQQGPRHSGDPGMARASIDHHHRDLHGAGAEPVQGFLAGLIDAPAVDDAGSTAACDCGWHPDLGPHYRVGRVWRIDGAALSTRGTGPGSRQTTMRQTSFGTNGVARHFPPLRAGRPEEGDAPEEFMFADYPARLREFARHAKTAANATFELQAKASFRTIAEGLSTMAEEMERKQRP
jgi:DNA-binding XRE family transcriptional regulator